MKRDQQMLMVERKLVSSGNDKQLQGCEINYGIKGNATFQWYFQIVLAGYKLEINLLDCD